MLTKLIPPQINLSGFQSLPVKEIGCWWLSIPGTPVMTHLAYGQSFLYYKSIADCTCQLHPIDILGEY